MELNYDNITALILALVLFGIAWVIRKRKN